GVLVHLRQGDPPDSRDCIGEPSRSPFQRRVMANSMQPAAQENANAHATIRSPGPKRVPRTIAAATAHPVARTSDPKDRVTATRGRRMLSRAAAVNAPAPTSEAAATQT